MLSTIKHASKPTKPPGSLPQEVKALAVVLRDEFDAPFRFYDTATGGLMLVPGQEEASETIAPREREVALELAAAERPKVVFLPGGRYLVGFPLAGLGPANLVALGVVPRWPGRGRRPCRSRRGSRNGADRSTTGWSGPAASATVTGARPSTTASR